MRVNHGFLVRLGWANGRLIGPREPMEDMEYTTMPQVAERMRERWEAIEEPAPTIA